MRCRLGWILAGVLTAGGVSSSACRPAPPVTARIMIGTTLGGLCEDAIKPFNASQPKLASGQPFTVTCDVRSSGDIVRELSDLIQGLHDKKIQPDDPRFPTLIVLESDLYHNQLLFRLHQQYPGHNYLSGANDSESPVLASSPLVFMAREDLAEGLRAGGDVLARLEQGPEHHAPPHRGGKNAVPDQGPLNVRYTHPNPAASNAGLEALVAEFAAAAGRRPDELTVADVQQHEAQVARIEGRISRYGYSSDRLADDLVRLGPHWATVAAVYESSVIEANSHREAGTARFVAVYPAMSYVSNMRAITFNAPWNSPADQEMAEKLTKYFLSTDIQKTVAGYGLHPGAPSIPLSAKLSAENGVDPLASARASFPARPEVVETMLEAWNKRVRKPSQVVVALAASSSMQGQKLAAAEDTLKRLFDRLGPLDRLEVLPFNAKVGQPIAIDPADPVTSYKKLVADTRAEGGARMFDAALAARDWLLQNYRADAINSILLLSDGDDAISKVQLETLEASLRQTGIGSNTWISLYAIGEGRDVAGHFERLAELADQTGGRFVQGTPEDVEDMIDQF